MVIASPLLKNWLQICSLQIELSDCQVRLHMQRASQVVLVLICTIPKNCVYILHMQKTGLWTLEVMYY